MIPSDTTLDALIRSLTSCAIPVPAKAAHWIGLRDQIAAELDNHQGEDLRTIAADLTADTITATIDTLTRERIDNAERRGVTYDLIEATANAVRVIRTGRDNIICTARKAFDAAAKVVTANAGAYAPDEPAEAVLGRGATVTAAWTAIRDTTSTLDAYLSLWVDMYGTPANADTYSGDWWQRVDAHAAYDSPHRWHALAAGGTALRLNTYAEALKLADDTPVKQLRAEPAFEGGFRAYRQVRDWGRTRSTSVRPVSRAHA